MNPAKTYYFIHRCIQSCKSEDQIKSCEVMINNIRYRFASQLADLALLKRIELLTTQYVAE